MRVRLHRLIKAMGPIQPTPCPPVNHAGRAWEDYEQQVRQRFSNTVAGKTVYDDYVNLGPVTVFDEDGKVTGQLPPAEASQEYRRRTEAGMTFRRRRRG